MRTGRFGQWTRTGKKTRYYRRRRRVPGRGALVLLGAALILLSVGWFATDLRILGHSLPPPEDETLRLTVPKMKRVKNVPVYNAPANDTASLDAGAIHVKGTGFPWEAEANVYIAGHRLGYPGTGSFLLFYDINKLRTGDRVIVRDAAGRRYVYEVFDRFVVPPDETSVMEPAPGRNIVSLQACTLPDYSRRLVVQAELVSR
ncbi:MAG: class E sortase [Actinomycetota bacterium]